MPGYYFDPEYSDKADIVEYLTRSLFISAEEAEARLAKADLF